MIIKVMQGSMNLIPKHQTIREYLKSANKRAFDILNPKKSK